MSLADVAAIAGAVVVVIGGVYVLLAYIFEPRLEAFIDSVVKKFMAPLEKLVEAVRAEGAADRLATNERLARGTAKMEVHESRIDTLEESSRAQGSGLAELKGEVRGLRAVIDRNAV